MFAIVDLETTGGNAKNGKIIEVAIVIHNGKRIIEEYSTLVNPGEPINSFVAALTGIRDEMVEDAPRFEDIADKIFELTEKRVFIAHNARFDYGFLKQEFKRTGKRFQRQHLCTVKLSKKILPGHGSYSLGKLCKDLEIPVKNRHRALGDAVATTALLEKLIFNDKGRLIEQMLKDELANSNLPAGLEPAAIKGLPEEVGVYYFLDEKGRKLYIGKSRNIRQRVISHFSGDLTSNRFRELKKEVAEIDFVLTGSELIAEIMEAGEIKRFMPKFNRAQRRKHYRYGVYVKELQDGYLSLETGILQPDREPLLKYTSKKWAQRAIDQLLAKNNLQVGARSLMDKEEYNNKLIELTRKHQFYTPSFLIIDEGREHDERSILQIENGEYVGYGFYNPEFVNGNVTDLFPFVKRDYDDPNKRSIIRKYLHKKHKFTLLEYETDLVRND